MAEVAQKQQNPGGPLLWKEISLTKKISILIFVGAFLIAAGLFVNYFATPKMGLLFRGLNNDSAAAVMARLDEMGVPYKLESGGNEIMVAKNRVDELRINLSSDGGLYGGGMGFELLDQTNLGVSESERRINYQRALQGELQRTIVQIDGINQARVHLVIPEPSVFIRETSTTTASVVLKLNPLSQLRKDQVMGIVYLIAGSVVNLAPDNITVIDTQGRILTEAGSGGFLPGEMTAAATLKQLDIKRAFEQELEFRLQGMLERVLGSGTVAAMVTAELDFDSQEISEIVYGEPVLRSRSHTEEEFEGSGFIPGGETGTDSNIPAYPTGGTGQGESVYSRLEDIENFEISETLTHAFKAPGEVKNLSASVIYDNSRGTLTARQMQDLENLVASALGLSLDRGDQISIASIGFDTTYLEETILAMEQAAEAERTQMYIRYGVTGVGILLAVLFLFMIMKQLKNYLEGQANYRAAVAATAMRSMVDDDEPLPMPAKKPEEKQQNRVKNITEQNPDTAISLLKMWLMEDQR